MWVVLCGHDNCHFYLSNNLAMASARENPPAIFEFSSLYYARLHNRITEF